MVIQEIDESSRKSLSFTSNLFLL